MFVLVALLAGAPAAAEPSPVIPSGQMKFIVRDSYPQDSLDKREEGDVGFTVAILPDGKAKDCTITKSSGFKRLDDATCAMLLERTNYVPDKDDAGKPKESRFSGTVNWAIPKRAKPAA
jgi:protein TonB